MSFSTNCTLTLSRLVADDAPLDESLQTDGTLDDNAFFGFTSERVLVGVCVFIEKNKKNQINIDNFMPMSYMTLRT